MIGIVKQCRGLFHNPLLVRTHQHHSSGLYGLGPLGSFTHDQYRLAEGWRLFLNPTRVGNYKIGPIKQPNKREII